MIAHIFGRVVEKFGSSVIVDVGGVGYEIQIPLSDYGAIELNDEVKFYTYHYIREQNEELFGFSKLATKKLFELLITVQGVGPKAGLAILSISDGERVRGAIANSDVAFVSKASGVAREPQSELWLICQIKLGDQIWLTLALICDEEVVTKR
jgi:Holliday junction DNA helicase RuvA